MNAREERGRDIAAKGRIHQRGSLWLVPSESGKEPYAVNLDAETPHCTCPDHELRQVKCKHMYAVEFTLKRETTPDGTTTVTKTVKVVYKQNWPAYNTAQCEEKARFMPLLADLCAVAEQPAQTLGRPRLPLCDMVFACAMKVYSGFSSRRFTSDLRTAYSDGLVVSKPHFNSVSNYLTDAALTPLLKELITLSSLPLKAVETDFAVDSSGFGTCRFVRWYDKKYGKDVEAHEWVKMHLMTGVQTNVVTSAEVSGWAANDSPFFMPLVKTTARHFQIDEVSADKAYLSHDNLNVVAGFGGTPFVPFKINTVPSTDATAWGRMYHLFAYNRQDFLQHYHKRSNAESTFSMIKAKFGDAVRSKSTTGQINEALCKVLCHNICVVIQSIHELGIDPTCCAGVPLAQIVGG